MELTGLLLTPTLYFHISAFIFLSIHLSPTVVPKRVIANPMKIQWSVIDLFSVFGGATLDCTSFRKSPLGQALLYWLASSVILKGRMQTRVPVIHIHDEVKSTNQITHNWGNTGHMQGHHNQASQIFNMIGWW